MFLRFGYAVGNLGLAGAILLILIGHLVTIPTAMAIAEIATNRRVEGGGEYYIISRSFGTTIGGAIGISLYLSQAVSVAFYMIALAEAFGPRTGLGPARLRLVAGPARGQPDGDPASGPVDSQKGRRDGSPHAVGRQRHSGRVTDPILLRPRKHRTRTGNPAGRDS